MENTQKIFPHNKDDFDRIRKSVTDELYKNVLPFWVKYSHDEVNGGWYTCLDIYGECYDTRKFLWLNGR